MKKMRFVVKITGVGEFQVVRIAPNGNYYWIACCESLGSARLVRKALEKFYSN